MSDVELVRLSTEEQTALTELLNPEATVETVIPDNITDEDLWKTLTVTCKGAGYVNWMALRLRPVIGRALYIARDHPSFWMNRGYNTFQDFLKRCVTQQLGLERTTLYDALLIAAKFPSLQPAEFQEIGSRNMRTLAKFTDETMPSYREHLEQAKILPATAFTSYAEERKLINKGEATPVVITICTSREVAHAWRKLKNDPITVNYCGTSDDGVIMMHLMEEFAGTYGVSLE